MEKPTKKRDIRVIREFYLSYHKSSKYHDGIPQMLVDHMRKGFSYASFAAVIGVTWETLNDWGHKHKDFQLARKIGEGKRAYHHEEIFMDLAASGSSAPAQKFLLQNLSEEYAFKEKSDVRLDHFGLPQLTLDFGDRFSGKV